ncbi:glycoside hydrolase [Teredinibacter haidensis]|uniref:glycoside hydrolase n=1 Tax=Teredinibacter haidensis TaxID=2731755 RepID=UPI000948ADE3|nr:glycoside hydrolase [Teredinibacter haidensis]
MSKKNFSLNVVSTVLITVLSVTSMNVVSEVKLTIDFDKTYQQIDHFGASDAWSINPTLNKWMLENKEENIENLADLLFSPEDGIGLSAWRFNIGAGSSEQGSDSAISDSYRRAELLMAAPGGEIDINKQKGQIRLLQEAHERGVADFVAFSNSPPVWATKNGLAHPGNSSNRSTIGSTNLKGDSVNHFAEFLVGVLQYLRGESVGVPVNYISPLNEPTWEWEGESQEGNRYNMTDAKNVYRALNSAIDKAGLADSVHIDGAETVEYAAALSDTYALEYNDSRYNSGMNSKNYGLYKNYIDELLGDSEMRDILGNHLSMHGYFSEAWADRMGPLRDLTWANLQKVSPGAKLWMSEVCILGGAGDVRLFEGGGFNVDDMDYALHVGKMIHRDLTRLNASAWHWWLALTPYDYKDGLLKINRSLDAESLQDSKVMWTLGNFSRFIRPGYLRVDLPEVDNLNGLMASAYKSPDDSKVVVVVINASNSVRDIDLDLVNLPAGKTVAQYQVYTTNASNELTPGGTTGDIYSIPARSTVTLVANLGEITAPPEARISFNENPIVAGGSVLFSDNSTNVPTSWSWDFEGGAPTVSTFSEATIAYPNVGLYDVSLTVTNSFGSDTLLFEDAVEVVDALDFAHCDNSGAITRENWLNQAMTGDEATDSSIASLPLSSNADTVDELVILETETDMGDSYGTRIRGYLCPPLTGEYTFWISGDNSVELWLSSNSNPVNTARVAYHTDWTNPREWTKYASQESAPVELDAGTLYYIEVLHKENSGGDNLAVGWKLPNGDLERPIPGARLLTFNVDTTPTPVPTPTSTVQPSSEPSRGGGGSINFGILFAGVLLLGINRFLKLA